MKTKTLNGGGGATKTSLNNPSTTSNKSKLFKPVVASSLALTLSASIASAAVPCGSGNSPQICWNGEQFSPDNLDLATQRGIFTPRYTGTSTTASTPIIVENLYFSFEHKPIEWNDATKTTPSLPPPTLPIHSISSLMAEEKHSS